SMPILYVILADRLGLKVAIAMAPSHLFVKATDPATGRVFNLETTSGAHVTRDEWYREQLPMSDLAVEKGTYLRALTRRETVAVMAELLIEHYQQTGRPRAVIAAANEILGVFPDFADVLVARASAQGRLLSEFQRKYASFEMIPPESRAEFQSLVAGNERDFARAHELGWQQPE
ncbi:MAG TPA: hypothetical protein VMF52_01895, partial [Steroidobacteraceae bacterium]|nr:hypothetical protein [Steroidobacteraceae bacterium]